MKSSSFIKAYYDYRLNALVRVMDEIDSFQIFEIAVDPKINGDAIIRAIDNVLEHIALCHRDKIISEKLVRLRNIFTEGKFAYESNLVNS